MQNNQLLSFYFSACFLLLAVVANAQQPGPAPIDGGISLLVAGVAAYGAKKVYDSRKK